MKEPRSTFLLLGGALIAVAVTLMHGCYNHVQAFNIRSNQSSPSAHSDGKGLGPDFAPDVDTDVSTDVGVESGTESVEINE